MANKKTKDAKKMVAFSMRPSLHQKLMEISAKKDISMSEYIAQVLIDKINQEGA
jgi:predicted HicB family RNase H-like nuclease